MSTLEQRRSFVPYHYKSLDGVSIRLLELSPGDQHEELTCSLITAPISQCPTYAALSYCWGDADPPSYIWCDSGYVRITANLASGLKHLRRKETSRLLWADQICINQQDIPERSSQVNLMRQFFARAGGVIAWLGPDDAGPQAPWAMDIIDKLASYTPSDPNQTWFSHQDLENEGFPGAWSPAWSAFKTFLRLPYFSRVWILQEMALASTSLLLWGKTVISIDRLHRSAIQLIRLGERSNGIFPASETSYFLSFLAIVSGRPGRSLLDLATATKGRRATDPRDLVFALRGLLKSEHEGIQADYSKSLAEVYTAAARFYIKESPRTLDFLSYAGTQALGPGTANETGSWPSWVPKMSSDDLDPLGAGVAGICADARADVKTDVSRWPDSSKLLVDGVYYERVAHVMEANADDLKTKTSRGFFRRVLATKAFCEQSKYKARPLLQSGQLFVLKLLTTLLCGAYTNLGFEYGRGWVPEPDYTMCTDFLRLVSLATSAPEDDKDIYGSSQSFKQGFKLAIDAMTAAQSRLQSSGPLSSCAEPLLSTAENLVSHPKWNDEDFASTSSALTNLAEFGDTRRLMTALGFVDSRRLFFVTEESSIGMGPPAIEPGDEVIVLFGAKAPCVVRPAKKTGEYHFIGECYIDDVMRGEFVRDLKTDGKLEGAVKTFTLV